jgi:hypothetical protein
VRGDVTGAGVHHDARLSGADLGLDLRLQVLRAHGVHDRLRDPAR